GCALLTVSRLRVPSSSTPPWSSSQDHADAYDDGERSSPSGVRAPPLSSCAPSSLRPPSVDDRGRQGATSHAPCDDDGDRSWASPCWSRCSRATNGSRSGPPAAPCRGSPSPSSFVAASTLLLPTVFAYARIVAV